MQDQPEETIKGDGGLAEGGFAYSSYGARHIAATLRAITDDHHVVELCIAALQPQLRVRASANLYLPLFVTDIRNDMGDGHALAGDE